MATNDQWPPRRRRFVIAAAALTLVLALSAPHVAVAQAGATTSKTNVATSPAATTRNAQTSSAGATIVSSAAGSTTKAGTIASTTKKTISTTVAATTRTTNATTTRTTQPATTRTTNATTVRTANATKIQTTQPATTRTTNATTIRSTNAATTQTTKPATTRATSATTTRTATNTTTVKPTATTTLKVLASTSGFAAVQTSPNPNTVVLPPSVVDGLTGGCVNATGSRSRMSKKHVDTMVAALSKYMKMTLRTDAFNQSYHPLVAGSVRLGFHACANGTCGGCLNVNNPSNNGLNFTINALTDFLHQMQAFAPFADCNITYADLWQMAASTALQMSLFNESGTNYSVPIVFGRTDCPTAPYTNDIIAYPDRRDTIDKVLSFFKVRFGFTPREVVALIGGGHALGVTRDMGTSAIKGQWDHSPDSATVDFYITLVNQTKVWLPTPIKYTNIAQPIYSFSKNDGLIFLTPDFSLARNITLKNETTGEPACELSACPFSSTYADVLLFSKNVTSWAQTFSTAYTRMTTAGYASGRLQAAV